MSRRKCVFLDRDGVLNRERGQYTFRIADFEILEGVKEGLRMLKKHDYVIVVITNQAGVAKKMYTREDVEACHAYLQRETGGLIDDLYFCPHHPLKTESLLRKPNSLMLEKAIARWEIEPEVSFMLGDSIRDIIAAEAVNVKGVLIGDKEGQYKNTPRANSLLDAVNRYILQSS